MTSSQPVRQASAWNIANALTVLRIALVPVFGWLLLLDSGEDDTYRILAAAVFALASITDRIDGDLARARGLVTDFGKVADPIADKTLVGMALVGLSLLGELPWWVTILVLAREIGVTAMRFVVIRHGIMAASRGGKVKTAVQGLAIFLYVLPLPGGWHVVAVVVMAVAVVVTVATGLDYVFRAHTLRTTSPRAIAKRERRAAMLREQRAKLRATTENARRAASKAQREGGSGPSRRSGQRGDPSAGAGSRGRATGRRADGAPDRGQDPSAAGPEATPATGPSAGAAAPGPHEGGVAEPRPSDGQP